MRTLTYYIATTLDGFVAGPESDVSGFLYDGDHIGGLADQFGDAFPTHAHELLGITPNGTQFDTVIMGWTTYAQGAAMGRTNPYAHLRQIVASGHERDLPPHIELTHDPVETVRQLKAQEGAGIYLCGGGSLASSLIDEIDRLVLKVNPVAIGSGVPLFAGARFDWRRFRRMRVIPFESGVTLLEFERC